MKSLKSLLVAICLFSMGSAFADYYKLGDWHHITTKSQEGVYVSVDYKIKKERYHSNKPATNYYASPLWINLGAENLGPNDEVRVVFLNKRMDRGYEYNEIEEQIDLSWDGEKFSGKMTYNPYKNYGNKTRTENIPVYYLGYAATGLYRQEVAIVINGYWLNFKNGNNFQFNIKDASQGLSWNW